jgi:hypothetical protein
VLAVQAGGMSDGLGFTNRRERLVPVTPRAMDVRLTPQRLGPRTRVGRAGGLQVRFEGPVQGPRALRSHAFCKKLGRLRHPSCPVGIAKSPAKSVPTDMNKHHRKLLLGLLGAATLATCSAPDVTGVSRAVGSQTLLDSTRTPKLVTCPTNETSSSTAVITPLGGILSAAGTTVSIPAGALLEPVTVTLTVPASNYMEIDVSVEGATSFLFQSPITVSLSYARCTRSNINASPNTVYHIDSDTHDLLEAMPTIDDKLSQTATFTTGHLSGYALAN